MSGGPNPIRYGSARYFRGYHSGVAPNSLTTARIARAVSAGNAAVLAGEVTGLSRRN
jgi:hypothetical protein